MADEARRQYANNHPIRELFNRLQLNTGPYESTHPQLDTRFLSVFQKRLSERFQEIELQMHLSVKLAYYKIIESVPKKLDILTAQEAVAVKSIQAEVFDSLPSDFSKEKKLPRYSIKDLFDLIAVGVQTEGLSQKLDDIKKGILSDINDGNTSAAVYHLLGEFTYGNMVILIFTLATKKDAFVYIKGGKQSYLNHDMIALRCSTHKLVLTFLMAMEGSDSAIWSDDMEYLELLSSNGLHSQTLFGKKCSYQQ